MLQTLNRKTLFITGASRGIGLAIAKRAAQDGANIVIAAKSVKEDNRLSGTIYSAAEEIESLGGRALPVSCDIRFEEQVQVAIDAAVSAFGGIDIVVNNASAIDLRNIDQLDMKRYDLMHSVNARGTYLCSKLALPHLRKSSNPHILTLSPPIDIKPKWFAPTLAYTMAKMGMSLVTLGLAKELSKDGIAVNSLWPETAIATAAVSNLLGGDAIIQRSRKPEIVADAAHAILTQDSKSYTGNFFIDVSVLDTLGITDFDSYAVNPDNDLVLDFFLDYPITNRVKKMGFGQSD